MAERMTFAPRPNLLTIDELSRLGHLLVDRGITRIRLTGGEPLVRPGILDLVRSLGRRIGAGLEEVTLTTNGTQLATLAEPLRDAGVRRVNVSLDTLDPARFRHIARRDALGPVLEGIAAARRARLSVKINMVALRGLNEDEIPAMLRWCAREGHDLSLIETMPLGSVADDRTDHYLPLDQVRRRLEEHYTLAPSLHRTGGPARYYQVAELGSRIGFITPLSANFCDSCNRIRIAATGTVYGCLGHDQKVELRDLFRGGDEEAVHAALDRLLSGKPRRHDFRIDAPAPAVARHMSVTGG